MSEEVETPQSQLWTDDGLKDHWRAAIHGVLEQYPEIIRVTVYGSRATGRHWKGSDIDLAYETVDGQPLSRKASTDIYFAMEDLYIPVTVSLYDRAAPRSKKFLPAIERDGKLWWKRAGVEAEREGRGGAEQSISGRRRQECG